MTTIPVYCKDCNSRNSWGRFPAKDIHTEAGRLLYYGYKCRVCGATTIVGVNDEQGEKDKQA